MFAQPETKCASHGSWHAVRGPWQVVTASIYGNDKCPQGAAFVQCHWLNWMLVTVWVQPRRTAIVAQHKV